MGRKEETQARFAGCRTTEGEEKSQSRVRKVSKV